jgi:hypothetical protein
VRPGDGGDDRQAQPGALRFAGPAGGTLEGLEQPADLIARHGRPGIGDGQDGASRRRAGG